MIDGGAGDDFTIGQGGDDELFGGAGSDSMLRDWRLLDSWWHGDDYLDGGNNDLMLGEGGSDTLFGRSFADVLLADADKYADVGIARYLGQRSANDARWGIAA